MVRSTDFRSTVRHGRRIGGMTMVVHAARRAADASPDAPVLIGFVVSKSVGNAVARNRVKRRLRHLVSDRLRPAVPTQGTSALPGGTRLVLRALPAAAGTPHRLDQDFARAWDRVLQTVSV